MNVSQKVVTVTGGGGSGCGRAIAATFAEHGAAVVVSDINDAGGHETIRLIEQRGGRAAFLHADVGNELQAQMLIEFAESKFGSLSVLVNNASSPHPASEGQAGWIGSLQTDLLGAIYATRWAIEAMRRSGEGSIVNISSISALWHGRKTPGGFPGYDVAKEGIRVNCLAPGWIASEGPRQDWESLTPSERKERGVPSKLLATQEIARMVLRLASDESLNGRVVLWWSEGQPRLIPWGDRGYRGAAEFPPPS